MQEVTERNKREFSPIEQGKLAAARELLERFHRENRLPGFGRGEGIALIGRMKTALGSPESGLTLADLGADEDELIRSISMQ